MHSVNITVAKAQLSSLLRDIEENDEEIIIERAGKPIAKIIKYKADNTCNRLGFAKGMIFLTESYDQWPEDVAISLGIKD